MIPTPIHTNIIRPIGNVNSKGSSQDILSEFYSPSMLHRLHISATGFMRRLLRLQSVTSTLQRFISPIAYFSLTPYSVVCSLCDIFVANLLVFGLSVDMYDIWSLYIDDYDQFYP